MAGRIGEGSIAVFNLAYNLQSIPLSVVGVSFSLAAFPAIAVSVARKNSVEVAKRISEGIRQIILWSLPIVALLIILRAHVVRVILGGGNFDWADTRLTAAALALFAVSTIFQSIQLFLSRSHYALGETKRPLIGNIVGGGLSVFFAIILLNFAMADGIFSPIASFLNIEDLPHAILALPLAFSLGSILSALLLFVFLGRNLVQQIAREIRTVIWQAALAAVLAALASYGVLRLTDGIFDLDTFLGVLGHGFLAGLAGLVVATYFLHRLGNREFRNMLRRFKDS